MRAAVLRDGAMVVRDEPDGLRTYCHLGTGNYNSTTARMYEDIGLLTADDEMGGDLAHPMLLSGRDDQDARRRERDRGRRADLEMPGPTQHEVHGDRIEGGKGHPPSGLYPAHREGMRIDVDGREELVERAFHRTTLPYARLCAHRVQSQWLRREASASIWRRATDREGYPTSPVNLACAVAMNAAISS